MVFSGSEAWRVMQAIAGRRSDRWRASSDSGPRAWGTTNAQAQVVTGDPGRAIVSAASERRC